MGLASVFPLPFPTRGWPQEPSGGQAVHQRGCSAPTGLGAGIAPCTTTERSVNPEVISSLSIIHIDLSRKLGFSQVVSTREKPQIKANQVLL